MSSINKAILVGNMGADIEVRSTQSGTKVGNLRIATSKKIKDQDRTQWHNVIIWDERKIDYLERFSKTGTKVYVEGEIETRKYTDKAGVEKYITEIVLGKFDSKVLILANGREEAKQPSAGSDAPPAEEGFTDEVPF